MSNIEFEEKTKIDTSLHSRNLQETNHTPFFFRLVLKTGIVKTETGAKYLLIIIAILLIGISFFNVFRIYRDPTAGTSPIYQEDLTPHLRSTLPPEVLKTIPYRNVQK
jgi:hypothetical protein